jgi:phosphoribosylaminoimidazole carboxylase PurE protein
MTNQTVEVGILMGSTSDLGVMEGASAVLKRFGIGCEVKVLSAHRAPKEVADYSENALERGVRVIIAGAGGAAHLAGVLAAHTTLPVIGVPVGIEPLKGQDSLLATVQMPKGIPVATVGISNSWNAGLLAIQILAAGGAKTNENLLEKLRDYKEEMRQKVLANKDNVAS